MAEKILSAGIMGLTTQIVEVEADMGGGDLGIFSIVGLPDKAISEAKERVRSAIKSLDLKFPRRKIIVNLAPADFKKYGPGYDLPIAISILSILYKFDFNFKDSVFLGELALNGDLRSINGILSIASSLQKNGIKKIYLPYNNYQEANIISGLEIFPIKNLKELFLFFLKKIIIKPIIGDNKNIKRDDALISPALNMANIKGQKQAKRALEISAAGSHNILLFGPPGSGKTMLARSLVSILPSLNQKEFLEINKIFSVAGKLNNKKLIFNRPFRAPHHTASSVSLLGGGSWPKPGEVSLAHRGILFFDEFSEFPKFILENLRQPLEDGFINICRTAYSVIFPANFMLVASMNPCPCGYLGDKNNKCICSNPQLLNYRKKISGPIVDRIDIFIEVPRVNFNNLISNNEEEPSFDIRCRVEQARKIQIGRFKNLGIISNSEMNVADIKKFCQVDKLTQELLKEAVEKLNLSARSYFRVLKLARTISDLKGNNDVEFNDVAEALQYKLNFK